MDIYFCLVLIADAISTNSKSISQFILFVYYRFQSFTFYLLITDFWLSNFLAFAHLRLFQLLVLHFLWFFQFFSTTLSLSLPAFQWMRHSSLLLVFVKPNLQIKKSQGIFQAFQVQSNIPFRTYLQPLLLKLPCCV